jgi:hypothetical protein
MRLWDFIQKLEYGKSDTGLKKLGNFNSDILDCWFTSGWTCLRWTFDGLFLGWSLHFYGSHFNNFQRHWRKLALLQECLQYYYSSCDQPWICTFYGWQYFSNQFHCKLKPIKWGWQKIHSIGHELRAHFFTNKGDRIGHVDCVGQYVHRRTLCFAWIIKLGCLGHFDPFLSAWSGAD